MASLAAASTAAVVLYFVAWIALAFVEPLLSPSIAPLPHSSVPWPPTPAIQLAFVAADGAALRRLAPASLRREAARWLRTALKRDDGGGCGVAWRVRAAGVVSASPLVSTNPLTAVVDLRQSSACGCGDPVIGGATAAAAQLAAPSAAGVAACLRNESGTLAAIAAALRAEVASPSCGHARSASAGGGRRCALRSRCSSRSRSARRSARRVVRGSAPCGDGSRRGWRPRGRTTLRRCTRRRCTLHRCRAAAPRWTRAMACTCCSRRTSPRSSTAPAHPIARGCRRRWRRRRRCSCYCTRRPNARGLSACSRRMAPRSPRAPASPSRAPARFCSGPTRARPPTTRRRRRRRRGPRRWWTWPRSSASCSGCRIAAGTAAARRESLRRAVVAAGGGGGGGSVGVAPAEVVAMQLGCLVLAREAADRLAVLADRPPPTDAAVTAHAAAAARHAATRAPTRPPAATPPRARRRRRRSATPRRRSATRRTRRC